ncbi:MAG: S1 RNA-binding domain-containing protein [Bacteroidales bacterium]|nr:S1 RNA-binding domain-containing protein [Bacteroidales bacterium]
MEKHKVGEIIEGTVINIRSFGAIMIFDDGSKGLLHISQIANTYIKNIFRYLVVGKTYQVKVIEVGEDNFIKVSMSQISQEEKDAFKTGSTKKTPVLEENIDFTALKEKLPEWIEKELEK